MNIAIRSQDAVSGRRYVLVFKSDHGSSLGESENRFLCRGLGSTNSEARKIGFWSFVDGFIAPEILGETPLTECKFRRSGSFERVGQYLGAVMQRSDDEVAERG